MKAGWQRAVSATALALSWLVLTAAPAAAAEPFECAANRICLYDEPGGAGDTFEIEIHWEGGFLLHSSGWNDRMDSVRDTARYPLWLYDRSADDTCWNLVDQVAVGEAKDLEPVDRNRIDLVAWVSFGSQECPVDPAP